MKKYIVRNYKGNIIESLSAFNRKHPGMKLIEAKEVDDQLRISAEEQPENQPEDEMLEEGAIKDGFEKLVAWFLAKLYLMDEKDAEKTLQDAVSNKETLQKELAKEGVELSESLDNIDEDLKSIAKGAGKLAKNVALGALKLGAFNMLAGALGASPYLVTVIGNIALGIIQDARNKKGLRKTIQNIAKRALTAAAFTLFMQMIGGGGYERATMTGNEDSDKSAIEKIGAGIKRAITGKQAHADTTMEYEAPKNLGAAVREFIPWLAKNKYVDGKILDPANPEHFVSRSELALGAAGREWGKIVEPLKKIYNVLFNSSK